MRHILITGGMGFIGHNLALYLHNKGYTVTIVDDLSHHLEHPRLTKYRLEVLSDKKIKFINNRYTSTLQLQYSPYAVVHLADPASVTQVNASPYASLQCGGALHHMCEMANIWNAKMIYVSSSMAYGNFTRLQQTEDSPLEPINLYGVMKKSFEDIVKVTCAAKKNYNIIRPSSVYGPGDNNKRVLGYFIDAALKGKDLNIIKGSSLLDFTYIDDLCAGIEQVIRYDQQGETFNLTYGQGRSVSEAALLILHLTGSKSHPDYLVHTDNHDPTVPVRGALDINNARVKLGYRPYIDLLHGLKTYTQWMKEHHDLFTD